MFLQKFLDWRPVWFNETTSASAGAEVVYISWNLKGIRREMRDPVSADLTAQQGQQTKHVNTATYKYTAGQLQLAGD